MAGSAGGAFDGLYQGSAGAADATSAIAPLLPSTTVYQQGPSTAPQLQNQITVPSTTYNGAGGILAGVGGFLGGLATQTGHIAEGAASWLAANAVNLATAPVRLGSGIANGWLDRSSIDSVNAQNQQLTANMNTLMGQYKSGAISKQAYQRGLNSIAQDYSNLDQQSTSLTNRVNFDETTTRQALIDTSSLLVTVLTAGFGSSTTTALRLGEGGLSLVPQTTQSAADWLASKVAAPLLEPAANIINGLASDSRLFSALDSATQNILQRATAEVVTQTGAAMTAGQIARATAVNVALKYPMFYNFTSTTADQLYSELDNAKYGDAARTLAFSALLLLSGGPIEQALKYGGAALKGVTDRTFGQTSFWDELSKFYGEQVPNGFAQSISKAANNIADLAERQEFIKNLAAVAEINVAAMNGDVAAGAFRVARGMQGTYSFDLKTISYDAAVKDMVNMSKNMRLAQETADKFNLGTVVIGRIDTRDKGDILNTLLSAGDTAGKFKAWEDWKTLHPNLAPANNTNFDTQIKNIIGKGGDDVALRGDIMGIKAETTVGGFPKDVADQMAKDGYIPIQPANIEAPFREGSGSLLTAHGNGEGFFTRAVQPLPVLGSVGQLFTSMGLSPIASAQHAYEMFADNVARNLSKTAAARIIEENIAKDEAAKAAQAATQTTAKEAVPSTFSKDELDFMKRQGITPETHPDLFKKATVTGDVQVGAGSATHEATSTASSQTSEHQMSTTDYMLKKLSNFAHGLKFPIQDMRQLTNKMVREALGVDSGAAMEVMNAIAKAHTDVPLAVRGLGDAAVDWTYRMPIATPVARRYLRIQGALRFSFNPFFQYLRVIPKTEMLTTAEGGGYLSSIFQGQGGQINDIRQALRDGGMFDTKPARLASMGGSESVDSVGSVESNISKRLLPMQERSIAGLIDAQAQRMGLSWQDYIKQQPQNVADTVQAIAEYDRKGNFINSPLARTLNIAFFPFRFDTKVATIFAKSLAGTSLVTQVSVLNGLFKAHDFLNSPQGQAWYAQNSTAISVFKYITPIASLNEAFQSLLPGHDHSLGNFGELGGLPFGWIPQLLDAEGLTNFNQPYVSPSTGQAVPSYVPTTLKGQAAIAVQDLISMLFSYPGAMMGFPSKASLTRGLALGLTGASKTTDMRQVTHPLNPAQQAQQRNIMAAGGKQPPIPPSYQSMPTGNMYIPPSSNEEDLTQTLRQKEAAKTRKLKKSQFAPEMPPGQTQMGVI